MQKIYFNGDIITMNDINETVPAILIEDDSIIFTGELSKAIKIANEDVEMVDLEGKTMLPGFIDSHSHFTGVANSLGQCDLKDAKSFMQIKEKIIDFIKINKIKENDWVCAFNYDHNNLQEHCHPDRFFLDTISTKHPIILIHVSSHMGVVNTLALKKMNITNDISDPEGGHYGRDVNSGELNGYLEEEAFIEFNKQRGMLPIEKLLDLMKKAQDLYSSNGITTVQEGMVNRQLFQLLKLAASKKIFKLDLIGYIDLLKDRDLLLGNIENKDYHNHFRIGGYKIFLDGSPQGKTAWMIKPYLNSQGYCGYPQFSDDQLYQLIAQAIEDHQQLLAHCNGDRACQQYISQFERYLNNYQGAKSYDPVMIHAQLVTKEQLVKMKKIQMIPSFFIAHTFYWGDVHIENLGYQRASQISPAKTAFNQGLKVTFHNDSPVISCDLMKTIWCAVNRKTKSGIDLGKEETVTVYQALQAITINGAYMYHEENIKGSLVAGKKADLVILNQNPLKTEPLNLDKIKVVETIKDGQTVYKSEKNLTGE